MNKHITNSKFFLTFYLGVLSAFAPFVMDMYLASMPELSEFFSTSASKVQMSLAVCVIGLAIGQLLFGTLSDRTGRKSPVLWSLIVYIVVTFACVYSKSISGFIAMRFVQGLTSSGGVVIARSIIADSYQGKELPKVYGMVSMINGVATVLAPMIGGLIALYHGWQGVFLVLLWIGVAMVPCTLYFRETLSVENRVSVAPNYIIQSIHKLIKNTKYMLPCMGFAMLMSIIIVNLSSAPFIMYNMGIGEGGVSLALGANAIVLAIIAMLSSCVGNQAKLMRISSIIILFGSIIIAVVLWRINSFIFYQTGVLILYFGLGALNTSSVSLAMEAGRTHAGLASALLGAFSYLSGGLFTFFEGLDNPFVTTPWLFLILAIITFIISHIPIEKF